MMTAPLTLSTRAICQRITPASARFGTSRPIAFPAHRTLFTARAASADIPASQVGIDMASKKDDVSGPMLEPSPVNTPWARTAITAAAIAAAAGTSAFLPANVAMFAHMTSWGAFFGASVWQSFIAGITMFKNMPRQMFGRVQSKLFPKYFALSTITNVAIIGTLPLLPSVTPSVTTWLYVALGCNLANLFVLEPVATKLMFQRYDIENKEQKSEEDQADIKKLYKKFGMYHGMSSLVNIVAFAGAVAHGWFLSSLIPL